MGDVYTEEELLPISALQHLLFCERQCALIHIEGVWNENRLTVEGRHLHERVDDGPAQTRGDVRITRSLPLRSLQLGLIGRADVVEFHGILSGGPGRPLPVEYKRGKPKPDDSDRVQLCAQAMCLEEMLKARVPSGALFYGRPRRRAEVAFDEQLRCTTERAAKRLHELIDSGVTPPATRAPKCENCSLLELCLPGAFGPRRSAARYVERAFLASECDGSLGRGGDA